MGKSPRRQTSVNSPVMDSGASTSSASKPSQGSNASATVNTASDLPAGPTATGATTRASSAAAIARQDNVIAALQKRIAMLEISLSASQPQSRAETLNVGTSNNNVAAEVQSRTQLPTVQLPESQSPAIANCTVPLSQPTDIRYTPPLFAASTAAANHMYSSTILGIDTPSIHSNSTTVPTFANTSATSTQSSSLPRKLQDLPDFCGKPEDWPIFYTAFIESSAIYGYSNYENNQRLLKSLKGYAREAVKSLLIHPNNVGNIIELLKFRFGRPEQLIRSQLCQIKEIAPISENAMIKIIPFATKVCNICVFLQSAHGGDLHLSNPTLLDELVSKLPLSKRVEWASFAALLQPHATVKHFSDWLSKLANIICTVCDDPYRDSKARMVLHTVQPQRSTRCPICQEQHKVAECARFLEYSVPRRWTEAKRLRLCFACLNLGHCTRNCNRRMLCSVEGCRRVHHKLLHEVVENINSSSRQLSPPNVKTYANRKTTSPHRSLNSQQSSLEARSAVLSCSSTDNKLLFRILPVTLYGNQRRVETYALLDEGSSITMIDSALVRDLGMRGSEQSLNVQWFGGHVAQESTFVVDLFISGAGMQKQHKLRNVYVVSNLQLPVQSLNRNDLGHECGHISQLPVQPYAQVRPKLLIGLDHCHLGLPLTTMKVKGHGPFIANTELGWVVFGPTSTTLPSPISCLHVNRQADQTLHNMVAEFFDTESFGVRAAPLLESEEDIRARDVLKSTTCRVDGRFETGLIWRSNNVKLPDSYNMALKRLVSVERKMSRDVNFAAEYKSIMDSYVAKKYARKLPPAEAAVHTPTTWYLPHFAVANPNKPGKLRMVFDAAAEVSGTSLNSQLLKGPQEYRPLPSILFHFREGAVAVCGDIKEMFHQVLIREDDRCAQRFLWRGGDATQPLDVYEMCVMTFGAACSPCAANYVKKVNALEHQDEHGTNSRAVKAILDHHYVDDFVDSFSSEEEAISVSKQVRAIHMNAGFELRNFTSNSQKVVAALDGTDVTRSIGKKESFVGERVLGLFWQSSSDCFGFKLKFHNVDEAVINGERRPTKRELLSIVMSIFDPLGFLSNFVIGAKLLMRELWKHDIHWNDPLPNDINVAWVKWRKQLPEVVKYAIPRFYFRNGAPQILQLHVFVDASENAFAAVAYLRSQSSSGKIDVAFVCAKTKCAPMKPLTVPRLELQAAVLGTRLMQCIRKEHSLKIKDYILWSDSKTVIKWIQCEHRRYKPFVQHRIAEILAATSISNWRWLPTKHNVADEATRANDRTDFNPAARWSRGPPFLQQDEQGWPSEDVIVTGNDEPDEELRSKFTLVIVSHNFLDFNRFSSFRRLVRAVAWVLRFVDNCRRRVQPDRCYDLTAKEVENAKRLLCRIVQREVYATEFQSIENGHDIAHDSKLLQLSPYKDEEGVLRVHGRIDAASWLPISTRRPIILPPDHQFTKLLVLHHHSAMWHQNIEATIGDIRRSYWVPRLRSLLRNVIASCAVCRLNKATPSAPWMGPLPSDKLTPHVRPFSYTGLDYFGPVTITVRRSTEKRWVALFTCLTVRAVHLELAHDLSTDSCIIAIRNFVNRRGVPIRIRSDNGKNFVGADREAKRFTEVFNCHRLQSELSQKNIQWVFNSPFNPSEGGAWERMVQCVKRVLRQTLKEVSPKEHTLISFLIEAENVVNSRPLTHLPITVDQEQPLTPNDFILGAANTAQTPIADVDLEKTCLLRKQWRIARQLRDHFWKRWITEYLPTLTRRVKWCQRTKPLKEGDLVFICDPNVPRREWCRGRVEKVYPGIDGEVRRADIRTSGGLKRRAVSKLAVLDIDGGESG
ncbi:uncharacterized protein LOC105220591 [Zeugodacus cucurbitae]|uniref:uncharacterized protein LOC105220591 n=1 Tax=Zeugodacus cucurbitae TaxID=28588 RepID=UPI0023D91499|nr:uncharacterized protein LOC105220591 [Zeugodacus cucurbitae]